MLPVPLSARGVGLCLILSNRQLSKLLHKIRILHHLCRNHSGYRKLLLLRSARVRIRQVLPQVNRHTKHLLHH